MIKVNLLPLKKKKKAKPLPTFIIVTICIAFVAAALMVYMNFFFQGRVTERKAKVAENDRTLAELEKKIKAVEDFENLNADYQKRKDIIEQLGRNKTLPVKILDEVSRLLPNGVWLTAMNIKDSDIALSCTAFNNTDVVNFVNNLKSSSLLTDVFLHESVQASATGMSTYNFKISFKVKS